MGWVKELVFGCGGPYKKLAALPAASVPVSDIYKNRAIPGNIGLAFEHLYV